MYRKNPKIRTSDKCAVITLKFEQYGFIVMHPKEADGFANRVDPDQTARSGSALFAKTYLSENLGSLR